jgi:hypothetical protein
MDNLTDNLTDDPRDDTWDTLIQNATQPDQRDVDAVNRALLKVRQHNRKHQIWFRTLQGGLATAAVVAGLTFWSFSHNTNNGTVEAQLAYDAYSDAAGGW